MLEAIFEDMLKELIQRPLKSQPASDSPRKPHVESTDALSPKLKSVSIAVPSRKSTPLTSPKAKVLKNSSSLKSLASGSPAVKSKKQEVGFMSPSHRRAEILQTAKKSPSPSPKGKKSGPKSPTRVQLRQPML